MNGGLKKLQQLKTNLWEKKPSIVTWKNHHLYFIYLLLLYLKIVITSLLKKRSDMI